MQSAKRFEDLWVWQQARELVKQTYKDFDKGNAAKDFAFRDQARRAATSVMSNLAEGFERSTDADFARFLDLAKASCGEVRSLYYTAEDLGYVQAGHAEEMRVITRKIAAGIAALAHHLRNSGR